MVLSNSIVTLFVAGSETRTADTKAKHGRVKTAWQSQCPMHILPFGFGRYVGLAASKFKTLYHGTKKYADFLEAQNKVNVPHHNCWVPHPLRVFAFVLTSREEHGLN